MRVRGRECYKTVCASKKVQYKRSCTTEVSDSEYCKIECASAVL